MEIQVFHGTQEERQSEETDGISEQNVVKISGGRYEPNTGPAPMMGVP